MSGASPEGTTAYWADRDAPAGHVRTWRGLLVGSVGWGSYLGEVSEEANAAYEAAAVAAYESGCNVFDTASNYRDQQSERDLGGAFAALGPQARDGLVVTSKAGFLHGDAAAGVPMPDFVRGEYLQPGAIGPDDIVAGCHCLHPAYIVGELERSRANLGLATLDVFFVHNPETQLAASVDRERFYDRLQQTFEALERQVELGHIRYYGLATWDGLRVPPDHPGHLDLANCLERAAAARRTAFGGDGSDHHLGAIQLPVNLAMPEAHLVPTQRGRLGPVPMLELAKEHDLLVLASASLMQTRIWGQIPEEWSQALETTGDLETALQFTRSIPGIHTALVGMGQPAHAKENLAFAARQAPDPKTVSLLLGPGGPHG
ncbi:MAG: aldo/keto reductase [Thermoplasmatota archaeon]